MNKRLLAILSAAIMLMSIVLPGALAETACKTGYTDISYFYRAFKSYYGMTPYEFRKKDKVIML